MGIAQDFVAFGRGLLRLFFGACHDLIWGSIEAIHHANVFQDVNGLASGQRGAVAAFHIALATGSVGIQGLAFGADLAVHGGGDVKVQLFGFGVDMALAGGRGMGLLGPKGLFPVGVRIHHIEVQVRNDFHGGGVLHSNLVGNGRDFVVDDAEEALRFDAHAQAVGQGGSEGSAQESLVHIQLPVKMAYLLSGGQIQRLAVDAHMNADEVDGIEDFRKVLGVAVLPPAHFGLIGVVDARDVGAL